MKLAFGTNYQKLAEETFATHMRTLHELDVKKDGDVYSVEGIDAFFKLGVGNVEDTGGGGGCVAPVTLVVQLNYTDQIIFELMMGIAHKKADALVYAVHDPVETVVSPILAHAVPDSTRTHRINASC